MAEIRWTSEAESWLKDIHDYIALDNPDAAAAVVVGIYEKTRLLRDHPELGYKYRSPNPKERFASSSMDITESPTSSPRGNESISSEYSMGRWK